MSLDVVLHNATVLIGDARGSRARSIGLRDGKVAAVSDGELSAPVRIDVGGRTVVPGFHDAHCHTSWYGTSLAELPLAAEDVTSVADVHRLVADRAARLPVGTWIIGSGLHPRRLGGSLPTRRELDRIAPDHPVWLIASSGHASVINSAVLAMLSFDHLDGRFPLELDEHGEPTGLLEEDAHACVLEQANPYRTADLVTAIGRAHQEYLKVGITAVQEAGVGAGLVGHGGAELAAYQEAREQDLLPVRTTLMPAAHALHTVEQSPRDRPRFALDLGIRTGLGDDRLRIGPVKFFTDGSILGGTAALHGGYPGRGDAAGSSPYDEQWIRRGLVEAHASGWQLAVHAQGDAAVDFVLDCIEQAQREHARRDPRHRIEHCSITTPEALERIVALGVVPSPQGRFVGVVGGALLDVLDEVQLANTYRGRSFLDRGITLPGSSDRPCTEGTPLAGIHDMVNRRTDTGVAFGPDEGISPQQALRAYAHGSAYAIHREQFHGSLLPGMAADLAILSDDPTSVDPATIRDIAVTATAVGGRVLFDSDGTFDGCNREDDRMTTSAWGIE